MKNITITIGALAIALTACATSTGQLADPPNGVAEAASAYVAFENLSDPTSVAEVRSRVDDSVLGVLRWDEAKDFGTLTMADSGTDLTVQGVTRDQRRELESTVLEVVEMYKHGPKGGGAAEDQEIGSDSEVGVSRSALSGKHPNGYLERVRPISGPAACWTGDMTYRAEGWAADPSNSTGSIAIHFYVANEATLRTAYPVWGYLGATVANIHRGDVNRVHGISGNHGFHFIIPERWDGDRGHPDDRAENLSVQAWGINVGAGKNERLAVPDRNINGYVKYGYHPKSTCKKLPCAPGSFTSKCYP